jgi:hypothetical protein
MLKAGLPVAVVAWLGSAHSAPIAPQLKPRKALSAKDQAAHAIDETRRSLLLATFTGGNIALGDMEDAIAKKVPRVRAELARPGGRERFLEQLIRYDLLVLEARRRGYAAHPQVALATRRAAIDAMLAHDLAVDPGSIPAADVAQFYEAHKSELSRPALRRASHIQLATEAQARALIVQLAGADRRRFAQLAREQSNDARTQRQSGELGYFDRKGKAAEGEALGTLPRALVEATFALKHVGDIGALPVAHDEAFSVVMLTGEMPAMVKSLAKAERGLRDRMAEERQAHALETLLAALRKEHAPELHVELADAIALEPATPLDIPEGFAAAPPDPRAPPRLVQPDGY